MVEDTKKCVNKIIALPAQKIYLLSSQPIIHDFSDSMITLEIKKDVSAYYKKHHDIPVSSVDEIDWNATRSGMTTQHEISFLKTFHNFRNTMSINKKWGRLDSDNCPMCAQEPETIHHLLSCKHHDIKYVRDNVI